jgi:hypothetical protein
MKGRSRGSKSRDASLESQADSRNPSAAHAAARGSGGLSEEQIRRRAYELYLQRGDAPGDELQDWLRAEIELRSQLGELAAQ